MLKIWEIPKVEPVERLVVIDRGANHHVNAGLLQANLSQRRFAEDCIVADGSENIFGMSSARGRSECRHLSAQPRVLGADLTRRNLRADFDRGAAGKCRYSEEDREGGRRFQLTRVAVATATIDG